MTIEEMQKRKKELGYSYVQISQLSGVPFSTVQKIFAGITTCPRYDTLCMLEKLFARPEDEVEDNQEKQQGEYTLEDYCMLAENNRVELIDGIIYDMPLPDVLHQHIVGEIYYQIKKYIRNSSKDYKIYIAPIEVQLDCDEKTMVQPDIVVLTDKSIDNKKCIYGPPDFVLEVTSKETSKKDYLTKLVKYMEAGVREFWLIDPECGGIIAYDFEGDRYSGYNNLDVSIPVGIFHDELLIDLSFVKELIEEYRIIKL